MLESIDSIHDNNGIYRKTTYLEKTDDVNFLFPILNFRMTLYKIQEQALLKYYENFDLCGSINKQTEKLIGDYSESIR